MNRADYAVIAAARDLCRSLSTPITRSELARSVFEKFPRAWDLLTPGQQEKWCWEQRRNEKDAGQLPLDGLDKDTILARTDWTDDLWKKQAHRYWLAAQHNLRLLDRLKAEYQAQKHVQLELDFEVSSE